MDNKKLAVIGAGVMGEVILSGMLDSKLFNPENLMITALRSQT
ncbi:MAG: hypothetical protein U0354_02440 [Candidatus Sericytochromatia bacterium]